MSYYTGSVTPVPTANRASYLAWVSAAWKVFQAHGALRMVETWGVDVPHGTLTDFHRAVQASEDETVVFAWIEWPDRAFADAAWQAVMQDPAMHALPPMPCDGKRMIHGGFAPVLADGASAGGGWYQGFVLVVPTANKDAYIRMARQVWPMFADTGALGTVEAWGEDVPRGERTDFYRATHAGDGETAMFSWICWPDRATCEAAATAMESAGSDMDMSQMPFDGKRMFWGGFEPLFDSAAQAPAAT